VSRLACLVLATLLAAPVAGQEHAGEPAAKRSISLWVRTELRSEEFPVIVADKDWESGEVRDYTSNSDYGSSRTSGTLAGFALTLSPAGSWTWNLGDGKARLDYRPTFARQPVADGAWHHLAASIDGEAHEARLYHDGREVAVYSLTGLGAWQGETRLREPAQGIELEDLQVLDEVLGAEHVAALWAARGGTTPPDGLEPEPVRELRVLAWNIWHGGRRDGGLVGVERVVRAIRESKADVVAMQETYGSGAEIADRLGWHFYLRSSNLSVMSRFPIRATHDLYQPFRLGGATLELSSGQFVRVFSLWIHYLPDYGAVIRAGEATPGGLVAAEMETRGAEIRDILVELEPLIADSQRIPLIVAGDFNSPSFLDWTPATAEKHGGHEVAWPVSTQMAAAGFGDSFRVVHPDPVLVDGRTWSPRFTESWQDRIDYVYIHGAALEPSASRMIDHIDPAWPSDHAAVLTTLAVKPPESERRELPVDTLPRPLFDELPAGLPAELEERLSGDEDLVDLGRALFFDPILSVDHSVACASCHRPDHGFADDVPLSLGVHGRRTLRNTPGLYNRALGESFMWDGRVATLREQVLMPIENELEMDLPVADAVARLATSETYAPRFEATLGRTPDSEGLALALTAFVERLVSGDSPADRFDAGRIAELSQNAKSGKWFFESRGSCWRCHSGQNLSDESFHNTGVGAAAATPVPGRFAITKLDEDRGRFKTPSLRGVSETAPYMHDGSIASLEEVVEFYRRGGNPNSHLDEVLEPIEMSDQDAANLVEFLQSLSSGD